MLSFGEVSHLFFFFFFNIWPGDLERAMVMTSLPPHLEEKIVGVQLILKERPSLRGLSPTIAMGGCIGSPRDGSSPNGDSSDGTGVGQSGK